MAKKAVKKKVNTHGGKREGSGQPKKEPTKTIRIPEAIEQQVLKLIAEHKKNNPTK